MFTFLALSAVKQYGNKLDFFRVCELENNNY